jgi:hypothetical protein
MPKQSSLPTGVSLNGKAYQATIRLQGKKYSLGTFPTIVEARIAYNNAKDYAKANGAEGLSQWIGAKQLAAIEAKEEHDITTQRSTDQLIATLAAIKAMTITHNSMQTIDQKIAAAKFKLTLAEGRERKARRFYEASIDPACPYEHTPLQQSQAKEALRLFTIDVDAAQQYYDSFFEKEAKLSPDKEAADLRRQRIAEKYAKKSKNITDIS